MAITKFIEANPSWYAKHAKAEPDDDGVQPSPSEPVENSAGGERAAFLAEAISKGAQEIAASSGLPWLDAYGQFVTTKRGAILQDAYDDAVRS
jgi:hypothetical protein